MTEERTPVAVHVVYFETATQLVLECDLEDIPALLPRLDLAVAWDHDVDHPWRSVTILRPWDVAEVFEGVEVLDEWHRDE